LFIPSWSRARYYCIELGSSSKFSRKTIVVEELMSKRKQEESGIHVVAENRKARHDYELFERFEAGIVLTGGEVKSIRGGEVNLKESYVREKGGEIFLMDCHISPYRFTSDSTYVPTKPRKLLLKRDEIKKIVMQSTRKGLTLVPTKLYFKNGRCKLEFAMARGKKSFDKREDIKAREAKRQIDRVMKRK
jgi:SsrA-binding protein